MGKQNSKVLDYLMNGNPMTQSTADVLSIKRLAARIHDLRARGYIIETKMVTVLNRDGERCKVAQYRMPQ